MFYFIIEVPLYPSLFASELLLNLFILFLLLFFFTYLFCLASERLTRAQWIDLRLLTFSLFGRVLRKGHWLDFIPVSSKALHPASVLRANLRLVVWRPDLIFI
jgi:hypothetical protein